MQHLFISRLGEVFAAMKVLKNEVSNIDRLKVAIAYEYDCDPSDVDIVSPINWNAPMYDYVYIEIQIYNEDGSLDISDTIELKNAKIY